jgi:cytochrome c
MSSRIWVIAVLILAASAASAATPAPPKLGRPATPDEIARIDISIPPDGKGLPAGSGSVSQGAAVFAQSEALLARAVRARRAATGSPAASAALASDNPIKTGHPLAPPRRC